MRQLKTGLNAYCIGGTGLRNHEFGLGDFIVKYTQVPGALITRTVDGANYMFTRAHESYRLKDSEGNRTDEYDWSKLNQLPWN